MKAWIKKFWGTSGPGPEADAALLVKAHKGAVPTQYAALQKYLTERYADVVTLTFGQIEDVMGSSLPALAFSQQDWWTTTSAQSGDHTQSDAWILAGRTAQPNLGARIVVFERGLTK